jgi:outer membrane protein OmpA-like peptidoglycan-associated protein
MKTNINHLRPGYWIFIAMLCAPLVLDSCKASNTTKGVAIGAGSGAVIGGAIGSQSGNTALGAILGAAVGGTTGAIIGHNMDKQAEELKNDLKGASVERVGEGIKITFDSGLMFAHDSYSLNPTTKVNLEDLGKILNKYSDTDILIEGHTDATGTEDYNMGLSRKRATAVSSYLETSGVKGSRMTSVGYGETQLLTNSDSDNRRVEVAIYANKKMRKLAEKGELGQ